MKDSNDETKGKKTVNLLYGKRDSHLIWNETLTFKKVIEKRSEKKTKKSKLETTIDEQKEKKEKRK